MALLYKLPLATLAMPQVPPRSNLPKDFRTIDGARREITPATARAIREARRARDSLADVFAELEESPPAFLRPTERGVDAARLAAGERARLAVPVARQLAWTTTPQALAHWRSVVESLGIFVFVFDMPLRDCRGFSLKESGAPVIVISKAEETEGARIFTLFHEYCHILIDQPGISDLNQKNSVEKYCNDFAAHFLMPEEALRQVLDLPTSRRAIDWDPAVIRYAARQLHVSQQALALRLENAGLAPKGYFDSFVALQPKPRIPRVREKPRGAPPSAVTLLELGPMFARAVLRGVDRGVISDLNAARVLDLSPKHFERLRDRVEGGRGPVPALS